jgi:7-carboxy-7-deazaguanine synthase
MNICEIFSSIQGESTLQGIPTVFVRLAGCNLNCIYCDTPYARNDGEMMSVEEICMKIAEFNLPYVCITGGEPLFQEETPRLAYECIKHGYRVSIETNGTIDASPLPEGVVRVIDIKCPGSGEYGKTHPSNIEHHRPTDEFKFVITDRDDFTYACQFIKEHGLTTVNALLFSPAYGILEPKTLADWLLNDMPHARLNIQLHRYIWPEDHRGR